MAAPQDYFILPLAITLAALEPEYPLLDAQNQILHSLKTSKHNTLVVLDDDPTGTQTCHDIAVLTVWDVPTLVEEFNSCSRGFFILTNSRALPPIDAEKLIRAICQNVAHAAEMAGQQVEIALRGDSTLRGHFPLEVEVVESVFGKADAWVLAPFFFQGGRYTINDVHYVAEGGELVPAGATAFAKDAMFGYKSSNLRDYIQEKAPGRFRPDQIHSITTEDIRRGGPLKVADQLVASSEGDIVIINAVAESDMHVFVAGLLLAQSTGKRYIYRTAAAFVSTRLGIRSTPPVAAAQLKLPFPRQAGGLIIAGSYVTKTTAQLKLLTNQLASSGKLVVLEIDVPKLIVSTENTSRETLRQVAADAEESLIAGKDVLVMTSRKLITGDNGLSSLVIGKKVAEALVSVLKQIKVRPRFLITKGGITSSDAATKGLNITRAMIIGQAAPGVPLWRCDQETSRHRGMPFVVFPGNVGEESTLCELVKAWS